MKITPNFTAFKISAKGMSIQKNKMDLVAENIANVDTTKTKNGTVYKRKFLQVVAEKEFRETLSQASNTLRMKTDNKDHINFIPTSEISGESKININSQVLQDNTVGERLYMPDHPDADQDGYVEMPNVNVVTEMVDMISATRSYEANLTAFNASKEIAKNALEI